MVAARPSRSAEARSTQDTLREPPPQGENWAGRAGGRQESVPNAAMSHALHEGISKRGLAFRASNAHTDLIDGIGSARRRLRDPFCSPPNKGNHPAGTPPPCL